MTDYDFEVKRIVSQARRAGAARIGLQFPEGLKDRAIAIAGEIEAGTKATVIIMADPTYGACDMKSDAAERLGVDLLVHFGHTSFRRRG
jgi:2-(3-amino-3-carboxypropyl)histidine synthase